MAVSRPLGRELYDGIDKKPVSRHQNRATCSKGSQSGPLPPNYRIYSVNMMSDYVKLQHAIFQHLYEQTPLINIAQECQLPLWKLRRSLAEWLKCPVESQPQGPADIHFNMRRPGRPPALHVDKEDLLEETIKYFIRQQTPLIRQGFRAPTQHFCRLLPTSRQRAIRFKDRLPSLR